MKNKKDRYFVAVKALWEDKGKLFIVKDSFGDWDLPGGRLLPSEFKTPLENVLRRKMKEELGESVRYEIGRPAVFFRHERKEKGKPVRIFAIGYRVKFLGGEIILSRRHPEGKWVLARGFRPEHYFTGGWLRGVKEYLRVRRR